jgi:hypothetical protein
MRADAAEAAAHYRTAFEHSQDPLVSFVCELGGTVTGLRDRMTAFFGGREDGAGGSGGDG